MLPIYLAMLDEQEDKDRFEELYLRCRGRLFSLALSILGSREDAEDALSETFFRTARSFSIISSLDRKKQEAYLVIICRNASIDIYRRNRRDSEHLDRTDAEPAGLSFEQEDSGRLADALKRLPKEHRDVLYIYCLFGCSAEESARQLGISKGALYTRVSRAKAALKKLLEEGDDDD